MKILKRLFFILLLFGTAIILFLPSGMWWIITGKDLISPLMDKIVIKYWDDDDSKT